MKNLSGKVAVVTGASQGLGVYIARALAREGASVALAARSVPLLEDVAAKIQGKTAVVGVDLTKSEQRDNLPKRVRAVWGQIDILVNNAGLEEVVRFERQDPEAIRHIIELNVIAPMLLTREILPEMLTRRSGHIVNMASLAGRAGMPFGSVYSGSKGALAEWSLSLHGELQGTGVGVSVIAPGFVTESGMFARKGREPPRSLGASKPEDVVSAVVRAIKNDLPEVVVNPKPARLLMALRALSPRAAIGVARRTGLIRFLESLADSAH